jgi:hypothetical protein
MIKQTLSGAWHFRQTEGEEWLPATVPGSAHTDLLALGRIPDQAIRPGPCAGGIGDGQRQMLGIVRVAALQFIPVARHVDFQQVHVVGAVNVSEVAAHLVGGVRDIPQRIIQKSKKLRAAVIQDAAYE